MSSPDWSITLGCILLLEITESSWLLVMHSFQQRCLYISFLISLVGWEPFLLFSWLFETMPLCYFSFLSLWPGLCLCLSAPCRVLLYLWLWKWQLKPHSTRRFTLCLGLRLWADSTWVAAWIHDVSTETLPSTGEHPASWSSSTVKEPSTLCKDPSGSTEEGRGYHKRWAGRSGPPSVSQVLGLFTSWASTTFLFEISILYQTRTHAHTLSHTCTHSLSLTHT